MPSLAPRLTNQSVMDVVKIDLSNPWIRGGERPLTAGACDFIRCLRDVTETGQSGLIAAGFCCQFLPELGSRNRKAHLRSGRSEDVSKMLQEKKQTHLHSSRLHVIVNEQ